MKVTCYQRSMTMMVMKLPCFCQERPDPGAWDRWFTLGHTAFSWSSRWFSWWNRSCPSVMCFQGTSQDVGLLRESWKASLHWSRHVQNNINPISCQPELAGAFQGKNILIKSIETFSISSQGILLSWTKVVSSGEAGLDQVLDSRWWRGARLEAVYGGRTILQRWSWRLQWRWRIRGSVWLSAIQSSGQEWGEETVWVNWKVWLT